MGVEISPLPKFHNGRPSTMDVAVMARDINLCAQVQQARTAQAQTRNE